MKQLKTIKYYKNQQQSPLGRAGLGKSFNFEVISFRFLEFSAFQLPLSASYSSFHFKLPSPAFEPIKPQKRIWKLLSLTDFNALFDLHLISTFLFLFCFFHHAPRCIQVFQFRLHITSSRSKQRRFKMSQICKFYLFVHSLAFFAVLPWDVETKRQAQKGRSNMTTTTTTTSTTTTTKSQGNVQSANEETKETVRDVRDFQQNVSYLKRGQENA